MLQPKPFDLSCIGDGDFLRNLETREDALSSDCLCMLLFESLLSMVFMRSTSIDEKVTRTSFDIPESASTSTSLAEVESCLNFLFEDFITFAAS